MTKCPALPKIIELSDCNGDPDKYEDHLYYDVFLNDLYNNKMYYNSKRVALKKYPTFNGREASFFHLTCKNYKKGEDRLPDFRRSERLGWIKPGIETNHIEECGDHCFLSYTKIVRDKKRVHLLNKEDRYMIVLEEREEYYLLITAFYIDYDKTLERKYKEYIKYKI